MENILVSACLLGVSCKYDGTDNFCREVVDLMPYVNLIPCCAEIMGGLSTPRPAAERVGDRVMTEGGTDVTFQFVHGAEQILKMAGLYHCRYAILKERSPSCGYGAIYDGSFQHNRVEGNGVAAGMLADHGIVIVGETGLDRLKEMLEIQDRQERKDYNL